LFLARSLKKGLGSFIWEKSRTIAYPYFMWSIITVVIKVPLEGMTNRGSSLSDLWLILYKPVGQYWFLYTLFVIFLFTSVLIQVRMKPWLLLIIAILIYPGILPFDVDCYWGVLCQASTFAIYVMLGMLVGSHRDLAAIRESPAVVLSVVAVAGLGLSSLGGLFSVIDAGAFEAVLAMSGAVAVMALAVLSVKAGAGRVLECLGRYSLEIFVAHTIASAGIRIVLQKLAHVTAPTPHLVIGTLTGLGAPVLLVLILKRLGFKYAFTIPTPLASPSATIENHTGGRLTT